MGFSIAKFRLLDYLRAHYADHLHHAIDISEVENNLAAPVTETTLTYDSIKEEIHLLPEKQATILQMMHQDGYTAKEVAKKNRYERISRKSCRTSRLQNIEETLRGKWGLPRK